MRSFSKASIQQKLLLVVFCTNLLGLAMACLAFEIYERASFRTSLVGERTAQADALALNTAAALTFNDRKSAQDLLEADRVGPISSPRVCTTSAEKSSPNTAAIRPRRGAKWPPRGKKEPS